jgi:ribonucleoside-diphosphate reductase alpha chain
MPTASTSQILGNNECFEPFTSNVYKRGTLSGEFIIVNKYLLKDLVQLGLWNESMKNSIIAANGSVQSIDEIPDNIKELYKTVWEIKQKAIIDMAADRGAFICQSQSLNLFMQNPNMAKLTSMHFYAWEKGLKTGMYYLRTKAAADAIKFTVEAPAKDSKSLGETQTSNLSAVESSAAVVVSSTQTSLIDEPDFAMQQIACALDNPDSCEMCSG